MSPTHCTTFRSTVASMYVNSQTLLDYCSHGSGIEHKNLRYRGEKRGDQKRGLRLRAVYFESRGTPSLPLLRYRSFFFLTQEASLTTPWVLRLPLSRFVTSARRFSYATVSLPPPAASSVPRAAGSCRGGAASD